MKRGTWWTAALLAALAGVWVGSRAHRTAAAISPSAGASVKTPLGEASAPPTGDDPWGPGLVSAARIPERLPAFTLADPDGHATPVATWQGRALILNFWATWCAPCQREIPLLKSVQAAWQGRGFTVVGIAVDFPDKVRQFASAHQVGYPLLVGEQDALDVAAALGVASPAFPFTVFTDRGGRIVAVFLGELHKPQADLILSAVDGLTGGEQELAAARKRIAAGLRQLGSNGVG
jgi:peroxiredoxin